jgi:hypothetical protein
MITFSNFLLLLVVVDKLVFNFQNIRDMYKGYAYQVFQFLIIYNFICKSLTQPTREKTTQTQAQLLCIQY